MKVKENKKSPTFSLDSTTLKTFDSRKIKGGLVVYFYPRDNTPGCTLAVSYTHLTLPTKRIV